jgi:hypothetical protein
MKAGHFLIGGSVIFAESTVSFGPLYANGPDINRMVEGEKAKPLHCIVGQSGYRKDTERWPKPGMFCESCLTLLISVRGK